MKFPQRIQSVASLCVLKHHTCLHTEPEVAEGIGKLAPQGPVCLVQTSSLSHYEFARMPYIGRKQYGYVLGEVLSVGIQRDGIGKTHGYGFAETEFQCLPLAAIACVLHKRYALYRTKQLCCSVC